MRQADFPDETAGRVARASNFLAGGGEMGALIRAHDWSVTGLGGPGHRPPTHKNTQTKKPFTIGAHTVYFQ